MICRTRDCSCRLSHPQIRLLQDTPGKGRAELMVDNLLDWLYNNGPSYSDRARRSKVEVQVGNYL